MQLRKLFLVFTPRFLGSCINYLKGLNLITGPKYKDSISFFQKSLQDSCGFEFLIYSNNKYLGIAHLWNQDLQAADEYLTRAKLLGKSERDAELYVYLATLYDARKNYAEAIKSYQLALDHFKDSPLIDKNKIKSRISELSNYK